MSDAISSIGSWLSSATGKGVLTGATAGGGFLQNFLANRQAQQKQKFVQDLITNPAKFSAFVQGFERPLAAGLTADVGRQADAYGAERGLGSSPAVMRSVDEQALAPFVQQQKDAATQAALQSLGIYENSPTTKPVDITSILKMLQSTPSTPSNPDITPSSGAQAPAITTPLPTPSVSSGGAGFDPTTMELGY